MDDVSCIGSETALVSCPNNSNHNCGHLEDAGVRCGNLTPFLIPTDIVTFPKIKSH